LLRHKAQQAGLDWQVESAGTNGYHIGEPPHKLARKVAMANGIDIGNQRARLFSKEVFDRFDKVYAMADDVLEEMMRIGHEKWDATKTDLFLNELYPGKNKSVPDPWYGEEPGFHEVFHMIDETCTAIIRKYGRKVQQA
jgi:protein-tyrosine phosphatase